MNPQPTIFISSIISEFYDLRGALKYFLGKSGFRVLMSEEPDFGADCGKDSLNNCKSQIEKSDYYLLLIGSNPGTIFEMDGTDTTVTFEEFKHYINLVRNGKSLNIIAFVRKNAWDSYAIKDISKISPIQVKLITELIENSLFDDKKIGRWRYTFDKFSDIISVLETNQNGLFLDATRKSTLFRAYIKREVTDLYRSLLEKNRETNEVQAVTEILDLPKIEFGSSLEPVYISQPLSSYIYVFSIYVANKDTLMRKINRVFNYIAQGEFSRFDSDTETYILPEYIKALMQCLEILEGIFDNGKNILLFKQLLDRDTNNFHIARFEYLVVRSSYLDLKTAISKLTSLIKLLHLDWYDFEKQPDSFYAYRGRSGDEISNEELLEFANRYYENLLPARN